MAVTVAGKSGQFTADESGKGQLLRRFHFHLFRSNKQKKFLLFSRIICSRFAASNNPFGGDVGLRSGKFRCFDRREVVITIAFGGTRMRSLRLRVSR